MAMKNILMVSPKFPDTYWSYKHALHFIGKKASMPPLGLSTVARMLPRDYNIRLVDVNLRRLRQRDLRWADAVFLSAMLVQRPSLEEIISRINKMQHRVPIVVGGPYATQYYDEIEGADSLIIGEAESGVLESFIEDFENGALKKAYARPVVRKKGIGREIDQKELAKLRTFFGREADIKIADSKPSIQESPVPRFDLLEIRKYASMAIQSSRGCPYNCDFCNEPTLFGHNPRLKTSEQVVQELEALYDLGYRGAVFVVDDNFIGNISGAEDLLPAVTEFQAKRDYPFRLFTEASINLAKHEKLMKGMRDAGFDQVFIGFEMPDARALGAMNKLPNKGIDLLDATRKIQSYGMEVTGGFILGCDGDPEDAAEKIFNFCQEAGIPTAMVGLLIALRGSPLYERLAEEKRLLGDSAGNNTHSFELNFEPAGGKSAEQIVQSYKDLLELLYGGDMKNYYERINTLFDNLGPSPNAARKVRLTELRALGLSLLEQNFKPYEKSYRRLLGHTIMHHAELFPEAVRFAITGEHLRRITDYSLKADSLRQHILERFDYYSDRLGEAVSSRIAHGGERLADLMDETDRFLKNSKKKIMKLPEDYRAAIIQRYHKESERLHKLLKEITEKDITHL